MFRRCSLFELEDLPWLPSWYRDLMTDCLQALSYRTKAYSNTQPILEFLLARTSKRHVIDFGSGSGGPWLQELYPNLKAKFKDLKLTLTDLFPNTETKRKIEEFYPLADVQYFDRAVDMTSPPADLDGIRIMFTSFHHLDPEGAKKCLQSAVDSNSPFGIFEVTDRSISQILMTVAIPFLVIFVTPFIEGKRLQRLIFTYVIPIVPLGCFWDGFVSNLRTYSSEELNELLKSLEGCDRFAFKQGKFTTCKPFKGNYLIGYLEERL